MENQSASGLTLNKVRLWSVEDYRQRQPNGAPDAPPASVEQADSVDEADLEQIDPRRWIFKPLPARPDTRQSPQDGQNVRPAERIRLLETRRSALSLQLFDPISKDRYHLDLGKKRLRILKPGQRRSQMLMVVATDFGRWPEAQSWIALYEGDDLKCYLAERPDNSWVEILESGIRTLSVVQIPPRFNETDKGTLILCGEDNTGYRLEAAKDKGSFDLYHLDQVKDGNGNYTSASGTKCEGRVFASHDRSLLFANQIAYGPSRDAEPTHYLWHSKGEIDPATGIRKGGYWKELRIADRVHTATYSAKVASGAGIPDPMRLEMTRKKGRDVIATLCVDKKSGKVTHIADDGTETELGVICRIDAFDRDGLLSSDLLTQLDVFSKDYTHRYVRYERKTGSEWALYRNDASPRGGPIKNYVVRARTPTEVYLQEIGGDVWIKFDLETSQVLLESKSRKGRFDRTHGSIQWKGSIKRDQPPHESMMTAWRVNYVSFDQANVPAGSLRQIGWRTWIEQRHGTFHAHVFDELGRDENAILLYDPARRIYLQINTKDMSGSIYASTVRPKKAYGVTYRGYVAPENVRLDEKPIMGFWEKTQHFNSSNNLVGTECRIASREHRPELWRTENRISCRSMLANEPVPYHDCASSCDGSDPIPHQGLPEWIKEQVSPPKTDSTCELGLVDLPVYRSTITFPTGTQVVDIFADRKATIFLRGSWVQVNPHTPFRVALGQNNRLSVAQFANEIGCATLRLCTNLMKPHERHNVMPDVAAFDRILKTDSAGFRSILDASAASTALNAASADAMHKTLKAMSAMAQHTYNFTPHGVHHDRAVLGSQRDQHMGHFVLQKDRDGFALIEKTAEDATLLHDLQNVVRAHGAGQSIFSWFADAVEIAVSTVVEIGEEIYETAEHVLEDTVETISNVGEDLLRGDLGAALTDLAQGGENIGSDLVKGVEDTVGTAVTGVKNVTVLTIKTAVDTVTYLVDSVPFLADALNGLVGMAGAAAGNFLRTLLDPLGWDDVIANSKAIEAMIVKGLDSLENSTTYLQNVIATFKTDLLANTEHAFDSFLASARSSGDQRRDTSESQSDAVHWIEWFIEKWFEHSHYSNPVADAAFGAIHPDAVSPAQELEAFLRDEMTKDGGKLKAPIDRALGDLTQIFANPIQSPIYILDAMIELVKGVAMLSIDAVGTVLEKIFELLANTISTFRDVIQQPWDVPFLTPFYKNLMDDNPLSLLSLISTVIAIPYTIIWKAAGFVTKPLQALISPAQSEDDDTEADKPSTYAILYGISHCALAVLSPLADISQATGIDKRAHANANFSPKMDASLGGGILLLSILAQFAGNPISFQDDYEMPDQETRLDILQAPSWWSHWIWWYLNAMLLKEAYVALSGLSGLSPGTQTEEDLSTLGNGLEWFSFAEGVVLMGMMATLDVMDRNKSTALDKVFEGRTDRFYHCTTAADAAKNIQDIDDLVTEVQESYPIWLEHKPHGRAALKQDPDKANAWIKELYEYHMWASFTRPGAESGIPLKGFQNIMDSFPLIARVAFADPLIKTAYMPIIGGTLDLVGHSSEGTVSIIRGIRRDLY